MNLVNFFFFFNKGSSVFDNNADYAENFEMQNNENYRNYIYTNNNENIYKEPKDDLNNIPSVFSGFSDTLLGYESKNDIIYENDNTEIFYSADEFSEDFNFNEMDQLEILDFEAKVATDPNITKNFPV